MAKCLRLVCAICIAATLHFTASSQSLSVNTTGNPAAASAILDVESTVKGMLLPRMTKTQKNAIPLPATGLLIYQTLPDSIGFHYYDGTKWVWLSNNSPIMDTINWKTHGNTGLTDATSFLGNIDNIPLSFRSNNEKVGRLDRTRLNYSFGRGAGNDLGVGHTSFGDSAGSNLNNGQAGVFIGYRSGVRTVGNNNTFVGSWSGEATTTGQGNAFFGTTSGISNTTGGNNTFLGHFAAYNNTTGAGNTVVGSQAFLNDTTGIANVAVGYQSMNTSRNANNNTAVGSYSLFSHRTGDLNTAVGYEAMGSDSAGVYNVAMGWRALRNNKTGVENTALGVGALEADSTGSWNTAVGRYASFSNKRGDFNVSMGYSASYVADTATNTVAIGSYAMSNNKQDNNVAVGYAAGYNAGSVPGGDPKEITFVGYEAGRGSWYSNKNTAVGFRALSNTTAGFGIYDAAGGRNTVIGDSAMAFSIGSSNTVIGTEALSNASDPAAPQFIYNNVAIGDSAMGAAKSNSGALYDNVAVGYKSLTQVKNQGNIAVGAYAGRQLGNTVWNTVVGYHALETTTTGSENTAIGTSSFRNNVTGFDNVGVGINTGLYVTSANNTFLGSYAGEGASGFSTGSSNTGVGYLALNDIRSGSQNVAMGLNALKADTSGTGNVAIGPYAMFSNLASDYNVAIGNNALYMHKRVGFTYNVALGASALEQDSSGYQNTGVGTSAFRINKTGILNTGVGINAGYYQKESYNTFIGGYSGVGERAPYSNVAADTGNFNTGLGAYSMWRVANGSNNVALGYSALYSDSSGNLNTAVGNGALYSNTGAHTNQAFGWNALFSYTGTGNGWNNAFGDRAAESLATGTQNVIMGSWAMLGNTSGSFNTALGNASMGGGVGPGGSNNTAVGNGSLYNTRADGNTAVGNNAGDGNFTGTFNTLVGYSADVSTTNLTNATAIGNGAIVGQSNALVLGNTLVDVGIGTSTPGAKLDVNGDFRLGTVAGGATVLNEIVKATVTGVIIPIIPLNGTVSVAVTVTGATTGSSVAISPTSSLTAGTIIAYARVTAADTVTIWFNNGTGGSIASSTEGFYITAIR